MKVKFYEQFHNPVTDSIPESVYKYMMGGEMDEDVEMNALLIAHLAYKNSKYLDKQKLEQLENEIKEELNDTFEEDDITFDKLMEKIEVKEVRENPNIEDFDSMFG